MKINHSIIIDAPRDQIVKYFIDPQYLPKYQDGFLRKEHISGSPGEVGSKSYMVYQNGKMEMILTETILNNELPDRFEALYEHKHMDNTMTAAFEDMGEGRTRYSSEIIYSRINWFLPKMMSILFPALYRKPPLKWMQKFKSFVESQN